MISVNPIAIFDFFFVQATHVALGWDIHYPLLMLTSSINPGYPTIHVPLISEFVDFSTPLAQFNPLSGRPPDAQNSSMVVANHPSTIAPTKEFLSLTASWLCSCFLSVSDLVSWISWIPLLLGFASPFLSTSTQFPEGRQYLDSHYLYKEDSWTTQREPSFLSDVVDPHNIWLQQNLMLRWVLLCDYCSCFILVEGL